MRVLIPQAGRSAEATGGRVTLSAGESVLGNGGSVVISAEKQALRLEVH